MDSIKGYNIEEHGDIFSIVKIVATKVTIYNAGEYITEIAQPELKNFDFNGYYEGDYHLVLTLNDEIVGPTDLYSGRLPEGEGDVYQSVTYPGVKIGMPTYCTCIIWNMSYNGGQDSMTESFGNTTEERLPLEHVCDKLGLPHKFEWAGACCT